MFAGIDMIEINSALFKRIRLNRNNHFYGFVMNICQIIYDSTLPSEQQGQYKFSDFARDENKMNQLFESFVRNFYRIEQTRYTVVKKEIIKWRFSNTNIEHFEYLPQMETDIT
jgi:5-methylcytosine-specific restriction enzyme subunit McrC